ncbi:MAG: helix-turn-helix transcriptional regulator [Synergistaceae bacterium]|nr:helix-turn-helix transcriptional regulator [Synergistaceae bacterium]
MSKKINPVLCSFIPVVELLGKMLGNDYEIVLHEVSDGDTSIIALVNGDLTGRDINAPMTDFGKFLMSNPKSLDIDYIANYPAEAGNGRPIRSGVALIKDEEGSLIGFLCINFDMTRASMLKDMGDFMMKTIPLSFEDVKTETFSHITGHNFLIESARKKFGKPLNFLNSEERKQCIKYMDSHGFFKLKGSIESLAKEMGRSRYTLYADLRSARKDLSEI